MNNLSSGHSSLRKIVTKIAYVLAVAMSVFHFVTAAIGALPTMEQRSLHLCFVLALIFLKPVIDADDTKAFGIKDALNVVIAILGIIATLYMFFLWDDLLIRAPFPDPADTIIGVILIVVVLEGTRRKLGNVIPILCGIFILYALFGNYIPIKSISHKGYSFVRLVSSLTQVMDGIYGQILGVSATYIFLFILFGALLEHSGASQFFVDLSIALFGKLRGGPAKVGTIASGLFGMVSGSAAANVMAVGPFTIPMMIKLGYQPKFAGGVMAVAGTGGQIMPPIMGAAAFIIAETLSISYFDVVKAAFLPAVLYYAALWFMVDIRAQKNNIKTLTAEEVPDWRPILRGGIHLVIPLVLLVVFLAVIRWSPLKSGFWTIVSLLVVAQIKKDTRMTLKKLLSAFADGAFGCLTVAIVCAAAGIIIGVLSLTGLSLKFSQLLVSMSMGITPILLVLTMIAGVILGMGLATTSVYIVLSVLVAPALTQMGVQPIAAHLFVFYFGILSTITPPVATASYAAAGITKTSPTELGFEGWRIGLAGYIIPFMFIYSPTLLMQGSYLEIAQSVITSLVGVYALSAALEGYLHKNLNIVFRVALGISALCLIYSGLLTDIIGLVLFVVVYVYNKRQSKLNQLPA